MFGLIRAREQDHEARQPGFIKTAQIFDSLETKQNILRLEKESKEMCPDQFKDNTYGYDTNYSKKGQQSKQQQAHDTAANVLFKNSISERRGVKDDLGPLERTVKQNLCQRALQDYRMVEDFNQERIDAFDSCP